MTHRALFLEADDTKAMPPCYRSHNVAPLVVFDFTEGTPSHNPMHPSNAERAKALRDLPPGLRGVRANWFGDSRLPPGHCRTKCMEWSLLIDEQYVDLVFLNNEEFPRSDAAYAELNADIAPVAAQARAACNWNDCIGGSGWWGPYSGKVIGTHSCPQSYEVGPLTTLWRWQRTIRLTAPNVVVHLPAMGKMIDAGNFEVVESTIYKRTEAMIRYAAKRGVRYYVLAAYMLPEPWQAPYISFVSWCLADCDRLYPLEATT